MDRLHNQLIEAARQLLKASGYCVENLWHVDDVHFMCEQHGMPAITDEEAMQVFCIAREQFDGEAGFSWPQLEKALAFYLANTSKKCKDPTRIFEVKAPNNG